MAKKSKSSFDSSRLLRIGAAVVVLAAIAYGIKFSASEAAVLPPGGSGGPTEVYVNNITGSDEKGDGSVNSPYGSVQKGLLAANSLAAQNIAVRVAGTGKAYELQDDLKIERDGVELINYGKRPMLLAKSPDNSLVRLELPGVNDTKVSGIDFVGVAFFAQGVQSVLLKQNRFMVQDPALLDQSNNGSAINFVSLGGDPQSNRDIVIDNNHVFVQKPSSVRLSAIRLDGAYVAQVYDNLFTAGSAAGIRSVLEVPAGEDIKMAANRFDRQYSSGSVYLMSQVEDAQVFDYKPAYE